MKMNKRNKLFAFFFVLIIFLVVLSIFSWFFFIRPITTYELANRHFESGDSVELTGTITGIEKINTSYGPMTLLKLDKPIPYRWGIPSDDYFLCYLIGNNSKEYEIDDQIHVTLHFEEYQFNGNKIVTAKELYSPLFLPTSIATALDAFSFFAGFELIFHSVDENGNVMYEIFTPNGDQYFLDIFNVSLLKGEEYSDDAVYDHVTEKNFFQKEYVSVTSCYQDNERIDFMDSLENGVSQNALIRYTDLNSNGLLDDHDLFTVNITPTADEYKIDSYLLLIGTEDLSLENIASGVKYIFNWYKGAFEQLEPRYIFSEEYTKSVALTYVSHDENGNFVDTTVKISRVRLDGGHPYTQYYFLLTVNDTIYYHNQYNHYQLSEGSISIDENISVEYIDADNNTLLDVDDLFIIRGLKNQSYVKLILFDDETYGDMIAKLNWIVGHGYIKGNVPTIYFKKEKLIPGSENIYQLNVSVAYQHPILALNSTLRVSLYQDSVLILDNVIVKAGVVGSYNGNRLSFVDADNDSYLSTDDYFTVECESNVIYEIKFPSLFGTYSSHSLVHS